MDIRDNYIAVFDSGVGGLSVLRHLVRLMPEERFLYLGDSANAPYGTRSREEVRKLSFDAAEKLQERGIKALVVACNTATSAAINELRFANPGLIVIGIEPALKLAADKFPGGRICVMATPMTLREQKFAALMERCEGKFTIHKRPAPGRVELIEGGKADSPETDALLDKLFGPLKGQLDAAVLGCTHYPFAAKALKRVLGPEVALLDGGEGTARETLRRLRLGGLLREGEGSVTIENSSGREDLLALSRELLYGE